ncbi:MAG: hypothetical protein R3A51_07630 [Nannocystaceae bacterium]
MNTPTALFTIARTKIAAALLVAGVALGVASAAHADPGARGQGKGRDKVERLCQKITCTEGQRAEITRAVQELKQKRKAAREAAGAQPGAKGKRGPRPQLTEAQRAERKQLKAQLAAEFRKPRPNEATMRQLYSKLGRGDRKAQGMADMHAFLMRIHKILTPAQRATIASAMERRGPRALMSGKGKHKGKGKGHGKGKRRGMARAASK